MKIISKIQKAGSEREATCVDGEIVPLCSRLSAEDIIFAVKQGLSPCNIFKIKAWNVSYGLWHPKSFYKAYEWTSVLI